MYEAEINERLYEITCVELFIQSSRLIYYFFINFTHLLRFVRTIVVHRNLLIFPSLTPFYYPSLYIPPCPAASVSLSSRIGPSTEQRSRPLFSPSPRLDCQTAAFLRPIRAAQRTSTDSPPPPHLPKKPRTPTTSAPSSRNDRPCGPSAAPLPPQTRCSSSSPSPSPSPSLFIPPCPAASFSPSSRRAPSRKQRPHALSSPVSYTGSPNCRLFTSPRLFGRFHRLKSSVSASPSEEAPNPSQLNVSKPKYYSLDMVTYTFSAGLHVGHPEGLHGH